MATELIKVLLDFKSNISQGLDTAINKLENFSEKIETVNGAFMPLSAAAAGGIFAAVKFGGEWEKAASNAARGLDLAGKDLEQFKGQAEDLAEKLSFQKTSTEILNLATDIGKLGVAKDDVLAFTEAVVKVGTATDSLDKLEDLSTDIAKIGNVFQFKSKDVEVFGGALNKLADATAATVPDIVNVTQRLSGIGKQSGLSSEQIAAWGATLISAGKDASTTATFMNSFLGVLGSGTNLSKDAQTGLKALGLEAKSLAQAFDKDANGTMLKFLDSVQKLDTVAQREVLGKIFGKEFSDDAALLATQVENLKNNLVAAGDTKGNIAKINSEFKAMAENSLEGQIRMIKGQLIEVAKVMGEAILPAIGKLLTAISPLIKGFAEIAKANPALVQIGVVILGITAAVSPLLIVANSVMGLATILPVIAGSVATLGAGLTTSLIPGMISLGSAVLPGIIAGFTTLGAAIWTALLPFAPIIAAIAGVAAGAYLIYKNWNNIGAFFNGIWEGVKSAFTSFNSWIQTSLGNLKTFIIDSIIRTLGSDTYDNLVVIFENIGKIFKGLYNVANNEINNFTNTVRNQWNGFTVWIGDNWNSAMTGLATNTNKATTYMSGQFESFSNTVNRAVQPLENFLNNLLNGASKQINSWISIVSGGFNSLGTWIYNWFNNFAKQTYAWGSGMIGNFVNGIKSQVQQATNAVAEMTGEMAKYLPHSPAEKGALSDLDKRGQYFTDTFLNGINRSGLTDFMNGIVGTPQTVPNIPSRNQRTSNIVQITYAPVITGSKQDAETILKTLQSKDKDLLDIIDTANKRSGRRFY